MRHHRAPLLTHRADGLGLAALLAAASVLAVMPASALAASTLNVPGTYSTIQSAIDAAVDGDMVLVAPGTYHERIDFLHKNITVQSSGGQASTIIDGGAAGVVVKMATDASETPTLRGFTIRNGAGDSSIDSGGIDVSGGPALIENNLITANLYCDAGAVQASFSSATIRGNVISNNRQHACSGGIGGGGVSIGGAGTVHLVDNVIDGNHDDGYGGGLSLFAAGTPTVERNVFRNNTAGAGGAIDLANASSALIQNNLFTGNVANGLGGAIHWLVPSGEPGPTVVNNTFVDNVGSGGSAIASDGFARSAAIFNNLIVGAGPGGVITCSGTYDPNPPQISFNDVVATSGSRYAGICPDGTGSGGNISVLPTFVNESAGDYHLIITSAGVDAGTSAGAPASDVDGDVRPQDGNGDGTAVVDLGFDEAPGMLDARIDISPGTTPNLIKLNGKGLTTTVGLLSSPSFDARQAVLSSLCFGDAESPGQRDCTLAKPAAVKDLDSDGDLDVSLVFDNTQTGIDMGDTQACLNGRVPSGRLFVACDAIVTR
jgi:hypothetical protein